MLPYAVVSTSPVILLSELRKHRFRPHVETVIPHPRADEILVFLSMASLFKQSRALNHPDHDTTKVVVLTSSLGLHEIEGLLPLDSTFIKGAWCATPLDVRVLRDKRAGTSLVRKEYFLTLVKNAVSGSLLNNLMTWMYTLPSSHAQHSARDNVVIWLCDCLPDNQLRSLLSDLSTTQFNELLGVLKTANVVRYQKVFRELRECGSPCPSDIRRIVDKYDVDIYEVNYCHAVYKRISR